MNHLPDSDCYQLNVDWIENLDWTLIEKTVLGGKCPTIDCVQSFNRCTIDENQGCLNFSVETRLSRLYPIVPDCDSILDLQSMYNRSQSMTIHYNPDSILDCTCSHRLSLDWMSFSIRLQSIQSSDNQATILKKKKNVFIPQKHNKTIPVFLRPFFFKLIKPTTTSQSGCLCQD